MPSIKSRERTAATPPKPKQTASTKKQSSTKQVASTKKTSSTKKA